MSEQDYSHVSLTALAFNTVVATYIRVYNFGLSSRQCATCCKSPGLDVTQTIEQGRDLWKR